LINLFYGERVHLAASNSKGKKTFLVIFSVLLLIFGVVSAVAGAAFMYLNSGNDSEGYAVSKPYTISTSSNVFVLWVGSPTSEAQLKWIITSANSKEVSAGWGAQSAVESYVEQYRFATPIYGWNYHASAYTASLNITSVEVTNQDKPAFVQAPDSLWLNHVSTSGSTTMYCTPINSADNNGMGMLVITNADGSNGVNATIQLGSKIAVYGYLPYLLIPICVVLLIIGLLLFKRARKQQPKNV
jgi:hypothetical protein